MWPDVAGCGRCWTSDMGVEPMLDMPLTPDICTLKSGRLSVNSGHLQFLQKHRSVNQWFLQIWCFVNQIAMPVNQIHSLVNLIRLSVNLHRFNPSPPAGFSIPLEIVELFSVELDGLSEIENTLLNVLIEFDGCIAHAAGG